MKKIALCSALLVVSTFLPAQAGIISIDGGFYQGTENRNTSDSNGNYDEIITDLDVSNGQANFIYNVNFNSIANQAVQVEFGGYENIYAKSSWERGIYEIESSTDTSPFSASLLSMADNMEFSPLVESGSIWAINEHHIDLLNNAESFYQSLSLGYTLSGSKSEEINGQTVISNFTYFYNAFLHFPPFDHYEDLRDVDIATVADMLNEHDGNYVTIGQGFNTHTTVFDSEGGYTSEAYSVFYLGSGVLATEVPEPSTVWLMSIILLFPLLKLRTKN